LFKTITCQNKWHAVKSPKKNSIGQNNQFGIYKTRLGKTCLEGMADETSAYYNNEIKIITLHKTAIELNLYWTKIYVCLKYYTVNLLLCADNDVFKIYFPNGVQQGD